MVRKGPPRPVRVLFTSNPLAGHLHPLVPFARALAARGHEVAFAAAPEGVALAEGAGLRAFPAGAGTTPATLAREMGVDLSAMDGPGRSALAQRHYFAGAPALGRRAAIHGLDLEVAGIALNEDGCFVSVDDALRTSAPDVFAAGDVATMRQMTHIAVLQGEVAGFNAARALGFGARGSADALLSPEARRMGGVADAGPDGTLLMDYSVVPQVIFSDPPFARVGLNEKEARAAGIEYSAARYDFADLGMAQVMGQTKGFVKMLAGRGDGRILGVQILGHQADTLIHEAIVAMAFGATAEQLARIPHYHPTLAEILTYPAEELAAAVRR